MDEFEERWVSEYLYMRKYGSNMRVYFCPNGIKLLKYKSRNGDVSCQMIDIYSWSFFKVTHFFYEKNNNKGVIKKYSFILNEIPFFDKSWNEMIHIIQDYALDTPSKKNLLINLLQQYLNDPKQDIKELKVADVIGFVPPNKVLPKGGWQLPDEFYFVSGNEFREDIEENIRRLCEFKIPKDYDVKKIFQEMYHVTTINHKDYIIAYGLIAPFLFALRSHTKLLPLLALGGPGGKGKTTMLEYMTVQWWGNLEEIIGSALMDSKPRVQGTFTGSTIPICVDDCEDLRPFVTGIFKRYTTTSERVRKLNPDQSKKMDCEYCSPAMMNFNALPIMFDDPQFRQRIIMLNIYSVKESEKWVEINNKIKKGAIGKYILNQTRDMTYEDLVSLYKQMPNMGVKTNRAKAIVRLMNLGAHLAKELFDLTLDLSELPEIIRQTLIAGNEEKIDLIYTQIQESKEFIISDISGVFENPHKKSWVRYRVKRHEYKGESGYLYTSDNALDLAARLGKNKRDLSLNTLYLTLQTEWKTVHKGSFYDNDSPSGSTRGIFIPDIEIDGTRYYIEHCDEIEDEINRATGTQNNNKIVNLSIGDE